MKRASITLILVVLAAISLIAPVTAAVGTTTTDAGIGICYLHDGKNYGLALNGTTWRSGLLHTDALGIFKPTNCEQVSIGYSLSYDVHFGSSPVVVSPLIGILTDISNGENGKQTRACFGVSITLTLD